MSDLALIRYNDTLEYEYVTCFSTHGVFSSEKIDHLSLPSGFFVYYMTAEQDGIVGKIVPPRKLDPKHEIFGTFISKEALAGNAAKHGAALDWGIDVTVHPDELFNFTDFFGNPPSIDCQIENAYQRQAQQLMEKRTKKKGRGSKKMEPRQREGR